MAAAEVITAVVSEREKTQRLSGNRVMNFRVTTILGWSMNWGLWYWTCEWSVGPWELSGSRVEVVGAGSGTRDPA